MKRITVFMLTILVSATALAQYKLTDQGSSLSFTIKNFGIETGGHFSGLQGDIIFNPANISAAKFDVSLDAASVNTNNSVRDSHLRGDSYFDVKNYPKIHFESSKVSAGKNGTFVLTGKLTIKKTSKLITFPFTAMATTDGYVFKGSFTINRKDFDIGGASTIADNLEVMLNVNATKQ